MLVNRYFQNKEINIKYVTNFRYSGAHDSSSVTVTNSKLYVTLLFSNLEKKMFKKQD